MAEIRVIDNATRPAGDELLASLEHATQVRIATAFAKASGVSRLWDAFKRVLSNGGELHVVYGLDFRITDPDAMERFRRLAVDYPETVRHHAYSEWGLTTTQTFHPKLYICSDAAREARVLIGSSNLTRGGLWDNTETNVVIAGRINDPAIAGAESIFNRITAEPSLFVPDQGYIEGYRLLHRRASTARFTPTPPPHLSPAYDELKRLEERLKRREEQVHGLVPTQKRVIIEAIRNLSAGSDEFVHLLPMTNEAERLARAAGAVFVWDSFPASVRGCINRNTLGNGGEDLFERWGGLLGREGLYRLTRAGRRYQGR